MNRMTHSRFDLRSSAAALLLSAASFLAGPAAYAQIGLPSSIIDPASGSLTADDKTQISRYVDANKAGLSGDTDAVSKARRALLAPLRTGPNTRISPAFRIEYAAILAPFIEPLAAGKSDDAAINAVRIAGELGTKEGLRTLAAAMKDTRASVRLVAAMGYERTLWISRAGDPAIGARDALAAIKELEAALRSEKDANVADALVMALESGVRAPSDKLPGVRAEAVRALAAAAGERATGPEAINLAAALARASGALQDAVAETDPRMALSRDSLKEAGGLAGELIALGVRTDAAAQPDKTKAEITQLLKQGENLYFFAHQKMGPGSKPLKVDLDKSWPTDTAKFKRDALQVLSVLRADPFGFPETRFATR